jgi:hypothetical protein
MQEMTSSIKGYAAVDSTGINVATVSPHPRGAMVNWLYVVPRVVISNSTSDQEIAASFERWSKTHGARIAEVIITEVEPS